MKKTAIMIFMGCLILPTLLWGVFMMLNRFGIIDMSELDMDTGEKRQKQEIYIEDGLNSLTMMLENYYNDRLPFRSVIILAGRDINSVMERPYNQFIDYWYEAKARPMDETEPKGGDTTLVEMETGLTEDESDNKIDSYIDDESMAMEVEDNKNIEDVIKESVEDTLMEESVTDDTVMDEESVNSSFYPLRLASKDVIYGRDNWLFYAKQSNRDNYLGNNLPDATTLNRYAQSVQNAGNICRIGNKQMRILICPDKETIYPEYYPSVEVISDYKRPQAIYDYLNNNTQEIILYPKAELIMAKNTCQVYYAHDSHWNYAGGYIAAANLLDSLGHHVKDLISCGYVQTVGQYKDLVLLGNLSISDYTGDVDYLIDIDSAVNIVSMNGIGNTGKIMNYISTAQNDSYIVFIGDSYNEHMIGYLADIYSHITFIHKDVMNDEPSSAYIKSADILILETVERNAESVEDMANCVAAVLSS